jgi:hypothetical protein
LYRIDGLPGGTIARLASRYLAADVSTQPSTLRVTPATDSLSRMGLRAEVSRGTAPKVCREIAARAGLELVD